MAKSEADFRHDGPVKRNTPHISVPLVCIIALLATIAGCLTCGTWLVEQNVSSFLQKVSAQTAKTLDERVNGEIARLDTMGHMLSESGEYTYKGYISLLRSHMGGYRRMGIFAPNDVLYSTAGEPRALDETDAIMQSILAQHASSYGLLSPVYADREDGEPVIMFAATLPSHERVPGVLYGVMDMELFAETILGDLAGQYVCITDESGKIIHATDPLRGILDETTTAQMKSTLLASANDNFSPMRWDKYRLVTAQLGFNGWLLTQIVPENEIWDETAYSILTVIIASLLMLALVIAITSHRILKRARGSENKVREAGIDRVTGINNHLGFATAAQDLMSRASSQRYALILMRTDAPEMFGAKYEYEAGRRLIEDIARTINAECESGETCARLDSGQFLMLLRYSDTADTMLRIKALNSHLLTLCPLRTHMYYGIYVNDDASATLDQMIERASEAALRMMRRGDLVGLYDDELHMQQLKEEALLNRSQEALTKGEFEVRYRPLRDMTTLKVVGAEAVALWHQPDGTVLSPSDYTPLLTRNTMMGPLNMYVLERVCQDMSEETRAGRTPGRILIRLSHENLIDSMFIPHSQQLLRQYGIDISRLEAIVSESVFADSETLTGNVVHRLHDDGLRVCVSDLGHGATSLRIFSDIPVDAIQLSPSLVEHSCDSERGRKLLSSMCSMALSFGIGVYAAAEFTQNQLEVMRECGCVCADDIDASELADRYCMLSEIPPAVIEKKSDNPFDDWD